MAAPLAKKAVIFDLDGTLADTIDIIQQHMVEAIGQHGYVVDPHAVRSLIGRPLDVSITMLTGVTDETELADIANTYYPRYTEATERKGDTLLFPEAVGLLRRLKDDGYAIGVVTAKITSEAEHLLRHVDIEKFVDVLVATDRVTHGKPAPDAALLALKELGADAAATWYVGDAISDVAMAHAAGMPALGITTGVASRPELEEVAEVVVDDLAEVYPIVTQTR